MEKEKLAKIIIEYYKNLQSTLEWIKNDIIYNNDLMELNKKHGKCNYDLLNKVDELKAKEDIVNELINDFDEILSDERVDIEGIKKII